MCRMAEVLVLTVRRGGGTPPYEGDNETVCRGRRPRRPIRFVTAFSFTGGVGAPRPTKF